MDVKNRSRDVNIRKPFGLRSNYVQITFNYVQFAQKLRKNYVIFQLFFQLFWSTREMLFFVVNWSKIINIHWTPGCCDTYFDEFQRNLVVWTMILSGCKQKCFEPMPIVTVTIVLLNGS